MSANVRPVPLRRSRGTPAEWRGPGPLPSRPSKALGQPTVPAALICNHAAMVDGAAETTADERPNPVHVVGTADEPQGTPEESIRDVGHYYGEDFFADDPPETDGTASARMAGYLTGVLPGIETLLDLINAEVLAPGSTDANEWEWKFRLGMEQRAWEARQARRSFADAVLHCAKRAISIAHGGLEGCPPGRMVTSAQHLAPTIWQAPNQAHHWEEGNFRLPVRECFESLAAEVDPVFAEYRSRSMSIEVLNLLRWRTSEAFRADLISIGEQSCPAERA